MLNNNIYINSNIIICINVFEQKRKKIKILLMNRIYKLQDLVETYEINVKIIVLQKKIKKAHLNIFYFLIKKSNKN
jgi:hypothetical protein